MNTDLFCYIASAGVDDYSIRRPAPTYAYISKVLYSIDYTSFEGMLKEPIKVVNYHATNSTAVTARGKHAGADFVWKGKKYSGAGVSVEFNRSKEDAYSIFLVILRSPDEERPFSAVC